MRGWEDAPSSILPLELLEWEAAAAVGKSIVTWTDWMNISSLELFV